MSGNPDIGRFITLEGVEGAGKSTQIKTIQSRLESAGITVCTTREPGGTPLAEGIRDLLLSTRYTVGAEEELLLMFAARSSHIREVILPALNNGAWVICDRFTDASFAYQGSGRGLPKEIIASLESFVQKSLTPDLTIIFDIPVKTGLARAKARSEQDRFELEELDFFNRIRNEYLNRARLNTEKYSVIDANQSLDKVTDQVNVLIDTFISVNQV